MAKKCSFSKQVNDVPEPSVYIAFTGVEVERMGEVEPLLNKTLEGVLQEGIDLDRLRTMSMSG